VPIYVVAVIINESSEADAMEIAMTNIIPTRKNTKCESAEFMPSLSALAQEVSINSYSHQWHNFKIPFCKKVIPPLFLAPRVPNDLNYKHSDCWHHTVDCMSVCLSARDAVDYIWQCVRFDYFSSRPLVDYLVD